MVGNCDSHQHPDVTFRLADVIEEVLGPQTRPAVMAWVATTFPGHLVSEYHLDGQMGHLFKNKTGLQNSTRQTESESSGCHMLAGSL